MSMATVKQLQRNLERKNKKIQKLKLVIEREIFDRAILVAELDRAIEMEKSREMQSRSTDEKLK